MQPHPKCPEIAEKPHCLASALAQTQCASMTCCQPSFGLGSQRLFFRGGRNQCDARLTKPLREQVIRTWRCANWTAFKTRWSPEMYKKFGARNTRLGPDPNSAWWVVLFEAGGPRFHEHRSTEPKFPKNFNVSPVKNTPTSLGVFGRKPRMAIEASTTEHTLAQVSLHLVQNLARRRNFS